MSDRVYRFAGRQFDVREFGHRLQIAGILFGGEGAGILCVMPGHENMPGMVSFFPGVAEWSAILAASDDPQYLDANTKAWLRKAQRQISGLVQQKVWARDGFQCMYCQRKMGDVQLSIDHWMPLELGGEDSESNYISACRKCNKDKGAVPPEEWCQLKGLDYRWFVNYLSAVNK